MSKSTDKQQKNYLNFQTKRWKNSLHISCVQATKDQLHHCKDLHTMIVAAFNTILVWAKERRVAYRGK